MFQATPFVVSVLQITLIGTLAWLLNASLSSRSAQTRHAIWITALIAIAVTLPSKWIIPPLEISTASMAWQAGVVEQAEINANVDMESTTALMDFSTGVDRAHAAQESLQENFVLDDGITPFSGQEFNAPVLSPATVPENDELLVLAAVSKSSHEWLLLDGLNLVYSLGFVFMVARITVAAARLRWMYRQGFDLPKDLRLLADGATATLSLNQRPRIRICQAVQTPLAFGIIRPTVLLPESFCDWSRACQQSVLTHELAHVARRDSIWDFLAQLTSAMYWFHPVVHWVDRAQKRERELATDERVVAAGVDCIQYANHLLDVLSDIGSKNTLPGAMAMSHFGDTQSRLATVLRMSQHHPKRSRVAWMAGVIIFASAAATSFQLVAQPPKTESQSSPIESQSQKQDSDTQTVADKPTNQQTAVAPIPVANQPKAVAVAPVRPEDQGNFFDRITTAKLIQDRHPGHTYSISGMVMGADQKPAVGAIVAIRAQRATTITSDVTRRDVEMIARTKTNQSGRYQFVNIPAVADSRKVVGTWQVVAALPSGDFGWKSIDFDRATESISPQANVSLRNTTTISGVYTGPNGIPISNAAVILSSLSDRDYGSYSDDAIYLFRSPIGLRTKSDKNGQFEFNGVPQGWVAGVSLLHDDWALKHSSIRTSDSIKTGRRYPDEPKHYLNWEVKASGSTIVAAKGFLIRGVVRTSDGAPVENCTLSSAWTVGASTNGNGEFIYRILPGEFLRTGKPADVMLRITPRDITQGLLSKTITLTESKAKSGDALSIELQQGIPVVGKVLSERGQSIAGVNVMALPNGNSVAGANLTLIHRPPPDGMIRPNQADAAPKGRSDAHGQYTFRPPVVYAANLVARASLETDNQHLWGEVTFPANPIGKDNVLIMKPMWRISGKVTVDGMPMQGVRVMVWRNGPGLTHAGSHSMNGNGKLVDANGQYEWFVPPNGSYYVYMYDSPFNGNPQGHYAVVKVGENELQAEEIQFTLADGVISGRVTLADGTPVSGIRVNSFPKFKDGNRMLLANPSPNTRRSVTREDGSFTVEGLPEGQYQVSASSVARPKTHYTATTNANVGDRDVHIVVTPVAKTTATNSPLIKSSQ